MWKTVGTACLSVVVVALSAMSVSNRSLRATAAQPRVAVIAELFTSEGCSSCPPADEVLTRLVTSQPVAGVEIIALGEHIDYWDRLGWRDPFSSRLFTRRQSQYDARVFHGNSIYTPQIVVDGASGSVGSDAAAVQRAIEQASRLPKAAVRIAPHPEGGEPAVDVRVEAGPELPLRQPADVVLALTEDHLVTNVKRGENSGRVLTHSAVVRSLSTIGGLSPEHRTFSMTVPIALLAEWKRENVRLTVLVQEAESRRIIGAGTTLLVNVVSRNSTATAGDARTRTP
jgi:hypothetical protein